MYSARKNRNSVFTNSNSQAIQSLRAKIKSLDKSNPTQHEFDPLSFGVELSQEQIIIFDKSKQIRRAYLIENKYKIGWVVDCDLNVCMLCWREFGWYRGRTKHHCRACGALVCHDCSPYFTDIPVLMEEKGSRVCKNCFGLKSGIFTPPPATVNNANTNIVSTVQRPGPVDTAATNLFDTPAVNKKGSNRQMTRSPKMQSEEKMLQKYLEEMEKIDRDQLPKYEEAYRIMREIIPLDIYKSKATRLVKRGLPEECANRIFNTKILWLIVTHPEDIKKIHLADFRSKYFYDGLDITEMRAIWYNLPKWNFESENPLEKGKAEWRDGFKSKLDDLVYKELIGKLSPALIRHQAYQEADFLHLFDPTLPLVPRFHRSASYNQNAIQSPAGGVDPYATPDQAESKYSPFCDSVDATSNVKDRRQRYMNNFVNENSEERREKKYRTLLEEINAEPVEEIDFDEDEEVPLQYMDEEEGEGEGEEVSSLEDGSTDELYHHSTSNSQKPFSQSAYKTPSSNHPQQQQQGKHINAKASSSLVHSNSGSDLPSLQKKSSSSSQQIPITGKSLHSAQALHSSLSRSLNSSTNPEQITPPKSALKQTSSYGNNHSNSHLLNTNQSTTSSISTLSNTYNNSHPHHHATANSPINHNNNSNSNTVKFSPPKSSNIPIQQAPNSASKAEKSYNQRMSQSLQNPSALAKAFSFQGDTQHSSQARERAMLDSNRMSPLRISSTNTLVKSSTNKTNSTSTGGRELGHNNSNSNNSERDYPILKPRMSSDSPPSTTLTNNTPHGVDPYSTPVSVDTFPDQHHHHTRHTDRWKTNQKFAVNHIDLETPASTTFTTVNSASSYKFLSTSKKYIPNINDFDSPDLFQAYNNSQNSSHLYENENEGEEEQHQPYETPVNHYPAPNTTVIPVSSSNINQNRDTSASRNTRYITPIQHKSQRAGTTTTNITANTNTNNGTTANPSQLSQSLSRATSRGTARLSPVNNNHTNTTNTHTSRMEADLQRLRTKEEIKLYLLIGNVSKTIAILNEANTRLSDYFTPTEAQEILWQCMTTDNINDAPLINQSILFLLDEKVVDVNSQESDKKQESLLQKAVIQDNEYLGRELVRRGADLLRMDREGQCPLSISLTCQFDWLVEEYHTSGREIQLLTKGSMDQKFQYVSYFIIAGYAKKAFEMIDQEYIRITPEEATELLNSCRGNFQQMKDPVETFELLESLGASIVD